ncbi:MAG: acetate--CoA ligase [Bacteriovorax sp.]|nr:acetate--CoA ligase [Bacteriovorax sp.]
MESHFTINKSPVEIENTNLKESMLAENISWADLLDQTIKRNHGYLNICHEALDNHSQEDMNNKTAIKFIGKSWPENNTDIKNISYGELLYQTKMLMNGLLRLGLAKGDVLFSLSPRKPESYLVALASLRAGIVFSPLFSVFGPEPIAARMIKGNAKALFTLASFYHKKIAPIRKSLNQLTYLIIFDDDGSAKNIPNYIDFKTLLNIHLEKNDRIDLIKTSADDLALLHFTSGTTGNPKGAMHVHSSVVYHQLSGKWALNFKKDDIFWCTADPGWVTGTSYGIISPLCNGVTLIIDEAEFNAKRWYEILEKFKVTSWYSAPTAMRMLMKAGEELPKEFDFSSVQFAASVGEPLNPEVIWWVKKNLGISLHDNWWQTETGGIMISNFSVMAIKPGSMGKPLPGIEIELVKLNDTLLEKIMEPDIEGQIAIKAGWPSMFRGYLGEDERYLKCFKDGWYLTGDLAKKDEQGYFWFVGRADDVIKSSGHLIGPFEVESVLMEHPAVLEAAVIGKPDLIAGELVKGFAVLKKNYTPTDALRLDIMSFARIHLGVSIAPKEISFVDNLPKTKSGKIMRRLLKARELGLPEGDLSMLETT